MEYGPAQRDLRPPAAPVHLGPARVDADASSKRLDVLRADRGLAAVAPAPAARLPVPSALHATASSRATASCRRSPRSPAAHLDACHLLAGAQARAVGRSGSRVELGVGVSAPRSPEHRAGHGALVEVEHLTKHFPVKQGVFARGKDVVHAVEDVSLTVQPGRDARHRRRVRLRQVDDRAADRAAARADRRHDPLRRPGHHAPLAARAAAAAARDADDLPGPVLVAEPAQDASARSSASRSRSTRPRRTRRRACSELLATRRAQPRALQPLPARVLRRPAPADRRRARARAAAEADRLRRAGLGARRLDPGADPEPARRASRASSTSPTSSSPTTCR